MGLYLSIEYGKLSVISPKSYQYVGSFSFREDSNYIAAFMRYTKHVYTQILC